MTLGLTPGACGAPPSENARSGSHAVTSGDVCNLGTLAHPGSCMDARGGGTTGTSDVIQSNGDDSYHEKQSDSFGGLSSAVLSRPSAVGCVRARRQLRQQRTGHAIGGRRLLFRRRVELGFEQRIERVQ
jgi:hypothetical protein